MDTDRKNEFLSRYHNYTKEALEKVAIETQSYIKWYQDRFEAINELLIEKIK